MNDKIALELLAAGRLTVEETMALLGSGPAPAAIQTQPIEQIKKHRNKPTQNHYTVEDHRKMIETYREYGCHLTRTARRLNIPRGTLLNHLRYAGIHPITTKYDLERVADWRLRRGMYLDLPLELTTPLGAFGGRR